MAGMAHPVRKLAAEAPVVSTFVALCCGVYLVASVLGRSVVDPVGTPADWGWGLLLDAGRMEAYGQWWRPLTAAFIHLDPAHLFFNMFLIFLIGRELEQHYGSAVIGWSMLAGASGGALACLAMQPDAAMGGASTIGYAFCVMLLGLAFARKQDLVAPFVLLAVNFGYTFFLGNVSLWGHVGGALAGAVVAGLLAMGAGYHDGRGRGGGSSGGGGGVVAPGVATTAAYEQKHGARSMERSGLSIPLFALVLTALTCWAGVTGFFWG